MANYCNYSNSISRSTIGGYAIRNRTSYANSNQGAQGVHSGNVSVSISNQFYPDLNNWAQRFGLDCRVTLGNTWDVSWFGNVGIYGHCSDGGYSAHHVGRAFDLTRINFANGQFVDMNWSWRQNITQQRRYLAVAAHLRRSFNVVLTYNYPNHADHIHFDNDANKRNDIQKLQPLDSSTSDTLIVQQACRLLNGSTIPVTGIWNAATDTAFNNLRAALGMSCKKVRGNTADCSTFLYSIFQDAIADRNATNRRLC